MGKVKLPKEICLALDKAGILKYEDSFLWSIIQWDKDKMKDDEKYLLNRFANRSGTLKLAKAIIFGYEVEETEKERKNRKSKECIVDYLKKNKHVYLTYEDVAEDILFLIKKNN